MPLPKLKKVFVSETRLRFCAIDLQISFLALAIASKKSKTISETCSKQLQFGAVSETWGLAISLHSRFMVMYYSRLLSLIQMGCSQMLILQQTTSAENQKISHLPHATATAEQLSIMESTVSNLIESVGRVSHDLALVFYRHFRKLNFQNIYVINQTPAVKHIFPFQSRFISVARFNVSDGAVLTGQSVKTGKICEILPFSSHSLV